MKLSVIIPTYNEEDTLEELVDRVLRVDVDKEVIIVDDGSTDGTSEILENLVRSDYVKVFYHPRNMGKGAAVRRGFREMKGEVAIIQDADLEYSPEEYPSLIELIAKGQADVVYGSRFLSGDNLFRPMQWFANRILTLVSNILFNAKLTDMETCYKVLKKEVLDTLALKSEGFNLEPEITAKVLKKGYLIQEVPISFRVRRSSEGKKITWIDGFRALWALIKYRFVD